VPNSKVGFLTSQPFSHICTHACTHTCIQTHTHTHTCTHTQALREQIEAARKTRADLFSSGEQSESISDDLGCVLQCVAVCCSVAKRVDLMLATDEQNESSSDDLRGVLQCVAVCCNVRGSPFSIKGTGRVLLRRSQVCVAVRLQCVAVVCSVLLCVATRVDLRLATDE